LYPVRAAGDAHLPAYDVAVVRRPKSGGLGRMRDCGLPTAGFGKRNAGCVQIFGLYVLEFSFADV